MDSEQGVALETLLHTLAQNTRVVGDTAKTVRALALDSRNVRPGTLFAALRGERTDGHRYIAQAAENGAVAIVMEEHCEVPAGVTAIVVPDSARAISQIADAFYDSPSHSLTVAGFTGTNGKTTATQMLAAIFEAAGFPAGTIGTIGARFHADEWPIENTTPLAPQVHGLLARMRDLGAKAVAMEVSSHALSLQRVRDIHFAVGALTNVTRDHLDFHKTFDAYAAAKHRLFEQAPCAVFNADDETGDRWSRELRTRKPVLTYGVKNAADVRPSSLEVRADGSSFTLDGRAFRVRIPGRFNISNALCAIAAARMLNISDEHAAEGLESLERVSGRMEHVHGGGVDAIVDYAHTPDALENALRSLREATGGRLIVVFGCGGDRDRGKRPLMGAAAARYADYAIVTSDNPRNEDPIAIIDDILPGIGEAPHAVQPDRRAAIELAVNEAVPGDMILIAGKGHETYQIAGSQVLPFDDAAIAREVLARRSAVKL